MPFGRQAGLSCDLPAGLGEVLPHLGGDAVGGQGALGRGVGGDRLAEREAPEGGIRGGAEAIEEPGLGGDGVGGEAGEGIAHEEVQLEGARPLDLPQIPAGLGRVGEL